MSARDTIRDKKMKILTTLCGDFPLILNKVLVKDLITQREYINLKSINKETVEGHVIELVDKIYNKGEERCRAFLDLLQTDEDLRTAFPELRHILNSTPVLSEPVQVSSAHKDDQDEQKNKEDLYQLKSQPVGLCVIINNKKFNGGSVREGTDQDARSLAEVFSWLGFRVLMCTDQTRDQMEETLTWFASLGDHVQQPKMSVQEWRDDRFAAPQQGVQHGDAFICCLLSHGRKDVVLGVDQKPLSIKEITKTFRATEQSVLTNKPKVFFIQACQGSGIQRGVLLKDLAADDCGSLSIPEEADVLVAMATVKDCAAMRNTTQGSWFIQSVCQQLKERCPRKEDLSTILHYVNDEVSQKEGSRRPGQVKQMPQVRFTLRKRLVLSPLHT
ncbi:caspase-8-like [Xenentodon cancila]